MIQVKVVAAAMLTRAVMTGMITRGVGTIVNVAGMLAFSGPAPAAAPPGQRADYAGTLAGTVAMSQNLHAELDGTGVTVHIVCPGIVATEFHEVQGMDLSAISWPGTSSPPPCPESIWAKWSSLPASRTTTFSGPSPA